MADLKNCPFCKSSEVVRYQPPTDMFNPFTIRCRKCNAQGPPSMTLKGAEDWWNTREENKDEICNQST